MTTAIAPHHVTDTSTKKGHVVLQRWLLACGIAGATLYPLADIVAVTRYPGFSYRDQAVSELFAIGAPTSKLVVTLFSISSTLLLLFAMGIWRSANGRRLVQWLAVMMAVNTLDALVLWNFFPMHMRGSQPTFTDLMHGLLAIDPFLLAAVVLGGVAFRGSFRVYTVATILFTSALAMMGFSYATAVFAGQPTPWMGATERASQYATNVWYATLAWVLLRERRPVESPSKPWRLPMHVALNRFALACGVISAVLYTSMLVFIPLAWREYSSATQTVSELSAIGAPTRTLWVPLGIAWALLYGVFGWAVWNSAESNKPLRVTGASILVAAVAGIFWPPMHLREVLAAGGGTLSDKLHIVWTVANAVFTLLAMGFAAAALGRRFRVYSIATMVILVAAGAVTSMYASQLQANRPTPWMGVWERINIVAWLLWVAVLSVVLWRIAHERAHASDDRSRPSARGARAPRRIRHGLPATERLTKTATPALTAATRATPRKP
jgi:Protein of unknown function (DUF998)